MVVVSGVNFVQNREKGSEVFACGLVGDLLQMCTDGRTERW